MLLAVTGDNPYFRVDQAEPEAAACIDGRQLINFCVYDYVGMSHDPEVAAAAKSAIGPLRHRRRRQSVDIRREAGAS